jgi:Plasmid pRiA4b ORF-3-like protein
MAKKKAAKKETKSDFLRKVLTRNPDLDFRQVNQRWAKAGHDGDISNPLYYKVRHDLGIKTVWTWVQTSPPDPKLFGAASPPAVAGGPSAGSRPTSGTGTVYQLKVTLADLEPPIWRRIEVPDVTLGELHDILQVVMGWHDSHMHQFIVDGTYYGQIMPDGFDLEIKDEDGVLLSQVIGDQKKARFVYEYDFGDSWQHEIVVEKTLEPEPKVHYPRCVEGARACPPEDCGGSWGYVDFLEAMADPKHENHRDMKEWIGGKFDPEKFSSVAVNRALKPLR